MSEQISHTVDVQVQERERQSSLLQFIARISVIAAGVLIVAIVALNLFGVTLPSIPLFLTFFVFIVLTLVSSALGQRGRYNTAVGIYMTSLALTIVSLMYLTGGTAGPFAVALVVVPVFAGLFGGGRPLRWSVGAVAVAYVVVAILQFSGLILPLGLALSVHRGLFVMVTVIVTIALGLIVGVFANSLRDALDAASLRGAALTAASDQTERAAQAEREVREREARSAAHLRETVAGYTEFLERVSAGDYEAHVDVGELDETIEGDSELHALGAYLNSTVETLVQTLSRMQTVQRRYTAQSWDTFVQSDRTRRGFRYAGNELVRDDDAWLYEMDRAIDEGAIAASDQEVAVPLIVNQEVVGVIGGRHPDGRPWTETELALVSDVTGQLAQTIESLRLLDETQRSAAREQMTRGITDNIRAASSVEDAMTRAVREIARVLNTSEAVARLGTETVLVAGDEGDVA